jgi:ribose-phosphate pyrophosphokinase
VSFIFSGNSNPILAHNVVTKLVRSNIIEGKSKVSKFSDGEIGVEIGNNVRGERAYIIQSTCAPTNDTLMELLLMADALRRSSAKITAIIPYYGYARQDRRPGYSRVPISARVVAEMIESVGIKHVVTIDLHATQIQGFFKIPVDNISATQLFVADIYRNWIDDNIIVVSPDVGGVARARSVAKHLNNVDLAIVDKRRPKANVSEVMNIIGDVEGKTCIIVDDLADTCGTLGKAANALIDVGGAKRVVAYVTHGILSGKALENIDNSKLHQLITTDTIPLPREFLGYTKIRQLSVANVLSETIGRIDNKQSISEILE